MDIFIFEELGWSGPRTENPFRIMVGGQVYKTPEGYSSFWTEADALRACAKYLGTVPLGDVKQIHRDVVNNPRC